MYRLGRTRPRRYQIFEWIRCDRRRCVYRRTARTHAAKRRGRLTEGRTVSACCQQNDVIAADAVHIRYINMDFVYAYAVRHFPGIERMTMYNIACQWAVHLEERMAQLPEDVRVDVAPFKELRYAIGKLHWHGHKQEDHSRFSLNWIPGSNRTDGEGIERRWWDFQPVANSTKMMGPGGREGILNDVFAFANWLKILGLGKRCLHLYFRVE